MRLPIIITCSICLAASAEREQLTLKDGRVLIGVYDGDAGTITLDGPGSAIVRIGKDQISNRSEAPPLLVKSIKPMADEAEKTKPPEDPTVALRAIQKRYEEERWQYCRSWIIAADFSGVPVPSLPDDPKKSEAMAYNIAVKLNDWLKPLRIAQQELKSGKETRSIQGGRSLVEILLEGNVMKVLADRDAVRSGKPITDPVLGW